MVTTRRSGVSRIIDGLLVVAFVTAAASWIASYGRTHHLFVTFPGGPAYLAEAGAGVVHVGWYKVPVVPVDRMQIAFRTRPAQALIWPRSFWEARGFALASGPRDKAIYVPHWTFLLVTGLPPTLGFLRRARESRRRLRLGLCPRCGYDLRGTTGRCPECGFDPTGVQPTKRNQVSIQGGVQPPPGARTTADAGAGLDPADV